MKNSLKKRSRIGDKTSLLLKFNYASSFLSFLFGIACYFYLEVVTVIPFIFWGYTVLNCLNVVTFNRHGNLVIMAVVTSILSLLSTLIITFYSGGIQSAFIFVLPVIVLAGYISTSAFGRIYLYAILTIILLIYWGSVSEVFFFENVVPPASKNMFGLLSLLFSVYLLEGVFGRNLLKAHFKMRKTKDEVEEKILEKENLLKEVHHRVKNNLQTISSLINLQSRNVEDLSIKKMLKSSQNRVIAMAMIHEMLYTREDASQIDCASYVQELVEHLVRSVKGTSSNIDIVIDIAEIKFNIDTAIPIGLLVNEAITNSLRYGIVDDAKGTVFVKMKREAEELVLEMGDDGKGFPDEITYKNSKSMGLQLMQKLVRQLRGSLHRAPKTKGTHYIIRFREVSGQLAENAQ
ncbi:sensor histidine kinase [Maribacter sp. 2-571]|uniref:sensor histidine kinase n=1 Tax=Maribacter sp. 2-571 TaxID=3417569 RepID=UPI003D32A510